MPAVKHPCTQCKGEYEMGTCLPTYLAQWIKIHRARC